MNLNNPNLITFQKASELFKYCPTSGVLWWKVRRGPVKAGTQAGYLDAHGYLVVRIGRLYKVHQIIFLLHYGYLPENDVDHIDKNKINNIPSNLREVTRICNCRNVDRRKDKSCDKVQGVCFYPRTKSYAVSIHIDYRRYHLGYYKDHIEAVAHRLAAEDCLDWNSCNNTSSAYQYMQKYLKGEL